MIETVDAFEFAVKMLDLKPRGPRFKSASRQKMSVLRARSLGLLRQV